MLNERGLVAWLLTTITAVVYTLYALPINTSIRLYTVIAVGLVFVLVSPICLSKLFNDLGLLLFAFSSK